MSRDTNQMRYIPFIIISILILSLQSCSKPDFDKALRDAESKMGLGRMDDALDAYESIVEDYPGHPGRSGVMLCMAKVLETKGGDPKRAIVVYTDVIEQYPLSKAERFAREKRAKIEKNRSNFSAAVEDYAALVKHFAGKDDRYRYQVMLASVYMTKGERDQARIELAPILQNEKMLPDVLEQAFFVYAESLFLDGRIELAAKWYKVFLEQFPDSALADEAKLHLATCYEEIGRLGVARDITKSAVGYPNKQVIDARIKSIDERGTKSSDKMDLLLPKPKQKPKPQAD